MIVRPRPRLLELIFALRGSTVVKAAPRIGVMTGFAAGVAGLARVWPGAFAHLSPAPFTLFGIALSIFLSFRNSACYDRWWEGRKIWGQIVIECRSLARQSQGLSPQTRARVLRDACGFAHALAASLQGGDARAAAAPWTRADLAGPNPCDALLADAGLACLEASAAGELDGWGRQLLEERLGALSTALGGAERIKATPLPFAYSLLLHRTAYLFCLLLPFGLVGAFGFFAPVLVAVISYTFFGLDALGDELEDPFGVDPNDLPLNALVRTVERDLLAALGVRDLPPPLAPVDYVLS